MLVKGPLQTAIIKMGSHYSSHAKPISERDLDPGRCRSRAKSEPMGIRDHPAGRTTLLKVI